MTTTMRTISDHTDAAWRFVTCAREWTRIIYNDANEKTPVTEDFSWAGKDQSLGLVILAVARINDLHGQWATAADVATLTGMTSSKATRVLKLFRQIADGHNGGTLRYSKVGNKNKYFVHDTIES